MSKKQIAIVLSIVLFAGALSGACSGGGSDTPQTDKTSGSSTEDIAAGCDAYDEVKLVVSVSESHPAITEMYRTLTEKFAAAHDNVTIEFQPKDFQSALQTIKLEMSSDNPPDIVQGNEGWSINGALWEAGLLANLDPYAEYYGWFDEFPEAALTVNRFTEDAKILGEGILTGLPVATSLVGVFYNKELLAQIGITDPTVLDDRDKFVETLETAKQAGLLPIMVGNAEKNYALHILSLLNGWFVSAEDINKWVFNREGQTYDDEARLKATTIYQDWMKQGYYNADMAAVSFPDARSRFSQGESVFFITGTWALGDIAAGLGDKAGFMLFPAGDIGRHQAVGGFSRPLSMSSKSKYPACAAQLLDFMVASDDAIEGTIASGRPAAALRGADFPVSDPLLAQHIAEFQRLDEVNGLFTWEDWPSPTMLELMGSEGQRLLAGEITPQEFNTAVQDNWEEFMASR